MAMSFGGQKYLMSAKKMALNKSSNYAIAMNKDNFSKKTDFYLGKLRANFAGTEFNIYDSGENPNKAMQIDKVRKQLGVIIIDKNFMGVKGPRKLRLMIPDIKESG